MAGWDHEFDVDVRDDAVAKHCFRIWRRTCARYRIEFSYYRERTTSGRRPRHWYVLLYNLSSFNAPLAVEEFAIEMRAVATMYSGQPRQRRLPLRLLRDVAYVNSPLPVEETLNERVPADARDRLVSMLESHRSVVSAYHRGLISPSEYLEAQHTLVIDLALALVPEASTRDSYPDLLKKWELPEDLAKGLQLLGTDRNAVKHRGEKARAEHAVVRGG